MKKLFSWFKPKLIWLVYILIALAAAGGIHVVQKLLMTPKPEKLPINVTPAPRSQPFQIRGSIPYWEQQAAFDTLKTHTASFNSVSLFWYLLGDDGMVRKYADAVADTGIISFAKERGVKTSAVVTNLPEESGTTWDSTPVELVINTALLRARHITALVELVRPQGFDGVTIDYEEVEDVDPRAFADYIKELNTALDAHNMFVGVALHPKRGTQSDRAYRFQDWKMLADAADELYIMAYGEHWDEGTPGPMASSEWVTEIIEYALDLKVPLEKFYLGVPLYGYDWNTDNDEAATGITYYEARQLMKKYGIASEWGEDTPSPFFAYTDEKGEKHEVWFESADSALDKVKLAEAAGFGGVTFWRLGEEDAALWGMINEWKASPKPQ